MNCSSRRSPSCQTVARQDEGRDFGGRPRHLSLTGHWDHAFRTGTEVLHLAEEQGLSDQAALAYRVLGNLRIDMGDDESVSPRSTR